MGTFTMPSLGADMEAGTLVEWLKKPGDSVQRGDVVAVVETDKGAIEVEIFETGRLERLLVEAGTKVPVGTPLAILAGDERAAPASSVTAKPRPTIAPSPSGNGATMTPAPPPLSASQLRTRPPVTGRHIRASPAARRAAQQQDIDLAGIIGTGPHGAILHQDVAAHRPRPPEPREHRTDFGPMRRAIAAAMARSKREIPHYYLTHSFDVGLAQQAMEDYNGKRRAQHRILFGVLLLKAVALALRDFPDFNGFYDNAFHPSQSIHVGVGITIRGGGLVAPAIHDTDRLPLPALMTKLRDLTGRVRTGGFRSSEISDPTVTVSSLGERGVESLLPIIYPPQVAILGFGTVVDRPWAVDRQVEVRPILTATLAADHRVTDGHAGALLLQRIDQLLQQPEEL